MHAFDRQTDSRTDGILTARPRLHCMQRSKNDHSAKIRIVLQAFNSVFVGMLARLALRSFLLIHLRSCVYHRPPTTAFVRRRYSVKVPKTSHSLSDRSFTLLCRVFGTYCLSTNVILNFLLYPLGVSPVLQRLAAPNDYCLLSTVRVYLLTYYTKRSQ